MILGTDTRRKTAFAIPVARGHGRVAALARSGRGREATDVVGKTALSALSVASEAVKLLSISPTVEGDALLAKVNKQSPMYEYSAL
jgi:hypothetical protein